MLAVLLALACAFSYGASDYTAGLATRRATALTTRRYGAMVQVTLAAEIARGIPVVLIVALVSRQHPALPALAWGAAAGITGIAGIMALCLAFLDTDFSVASPVSAVSAGVFSVLVGTLLGERPGPLAGGGITLAIPAIVLVSARRDRATGAQRASLAVLFRRPGPGLRWGLAAGAAFALSLTSLHEAGPGSGLWPLAVAEVAGIAAAAGAAAVTRSLRPPPRPARWLSLTSGTIAAAGLFCYYIATHHGLLSVTAVVYSLFPAGTVLLAWLVSKEELTRVNLAGFGLAAASVALIAAGQIR